MNTLSRRFVSLLPVAFAFPLIAFAQPAEKPVPVLAEPNHKVTLENTHVRVLDVRFPPGATSLYHTHTVPSVIVDLADSFIQSQELGAAPGAPRQVVPGTTRYAAYDEKPLTHRVTNTGKTEFRVLDVELVRSPASVSTAPAIASPDMKLEWEQKLARLYKLSLAAGKRTEVTARRCAHLLIGISGEVWTTSFFNGGKKVSRLKAGEYLYFAPGNLGLVMNNETDAAACVLLELK